LRGVDDQEWYRSPTSASYPWTYIDEFTGAASSFYGMTSLIWAPSAAIIGILAGTLFAYALWPLRPKK
jgi:hypothetical protein